MPAGGGEPRGGLAVLKAKMMGTSFVKECNTTAQFVAGPGAYTRPLFGST